MKIKSFLLVLSFFAISVGVHAQLVAPKITVKDCSNEEHDLYKKLNEGKIIVIGWTMPCGTCASPLLEVHNAILNFSLQNPNTVEYWVNDDYANTSCATVSSWCKSNGINNATYFSSSALTMEDFGSPGMPKVVVIGCTNGNVYYNVDDVPTGSGALAAINKAWQDMQDACKTAGVDELDKPIFSLFPVPVNNILNVKFEKQPSDQVAQYAVFNLLGEKVSDSTIYESTAALGDISIDVSHLQAGVYFINLVSSKGSFSKKFIKA